MTERTCSIEENGERCGRKVAGRGWCNMHYQRWQHHGDPLITLVPRRTATVCTAPECDGAPYQRDLCLRHYREYQKSQRGPCSADGCERPWDAEGLCSMHYQRKRRTGSTDDPKQVGRPCSVEGCEKRARAREMCPAHYGTWRKHGTPVVVKPPKIRRQCSVADCPAMAVRRNGMCETHYRDEMARDRPRCTVPDCTRPSVREGFCEPHGGWSRRLFMMYGITEEQYNALLEAQGGACAICGRTPELAGRGKRLVVDHDHQCCRGTGACGKCVRGLLCQWCNRILGLAQDDPARLSAAMSYLYDTGTAQRKTPRPAKPKRKPGAQEEQLALIA
jgi:hypothetical protein